MPNQLNSNSLGENRICDTRILNLNTFFPFESPNFYFYLYGNCVIQINSEFIALKTLVNSRINGKYKLLISVEGLKVLLD